MLNSARDRRDVMILATSLKGALTIVGDRVLPWAVIFIHVVGVRRTVLSLVTPFPSPIGELFSRFAQRFSQGSRPDGAAPLWPCI